MGKARFTRTRWLAATSFAVLTAVGLGIGSASAATDTTTTAAAENGGTALTEIVVTARKRGENIQTVPLAVQSYTGKQLGEQGIRQATDLSRSVPGVVVGPASGKTTGAVFQVRGQVASDTTLQFGTPVGVYEDGVNIPHPDGANGAFFDLDSIEVLKGPQGTLYGRNTTGGAVLITTRDANFNGYHGFLQGEVGNYDDWRLTGAVNFPIIEDKLAVRLAADHWSRQGYGKSIVTGQHMGGDRDDTVVRGRIRFTPTPTFASDTTIEYGDLNRVNDLIKADAYDLSSTPGAAGVTICNPAFTGAFATGETTPKGVPATCAPGAISFPILDPNTHNPAEYTNRNLQPQASLNAEFGAGTFNLNNLIGGIQFNTATSLPVSDKVRTFHVAETLTANLGDIATLKSITGYHWFQDFSAFDLTGLPGNLAAVNQPIQTVAGNTPLSSSLTGPDEEDGQLTQEFDLSGKAGNLTWLAGAFGSRDKGRNEQWASVIAAVGPTTFFVYATPYYRNTTWAFFTQEDYKFTDWFSVTGGLRYTHEDVLQDSANFLYFPFNPPAAQYFCAAGPNAGTVHPSLYSCSIPQSLTAAVPNTNIQEPVAHASSEGISYLFSANFQITPDMLLYFRTARGFHGSVLQNRAFTQAPAAPETAIDYEVGYKAEFFDHHLRANLAAYLTKYNNKQENVITCGPTGCITLVFNAASATIKGFEGDFDVIPLPGLTLSATLSYTDARYGTFFPSSTIGSGAVNDAGQPFPTVPPWSYSLRGRYETPVGPGNLSLEADWAWHSALPFTPFNTDPTAPPGLQAQFLQAIGLLNGNIGYTLPNYGLTFSLFATNLLDLHYQLAGVVANIDGVYAGSVQEPRMFGFRIRKTFGPGE